MNLRFVSLTGADDKVDIKDLEKLSNKYPLFECAILMFPQSEGKARNPVKSWREKFYHSSVENRALHLCGTSIDQLAQEDSDLIKEILNFQRVQINLMPRYASEQLVEQLVKVVEKFPQIEFITQYNEKNTQYFPYWNTVENHSYLYDASLGKGVAPSQWNAPVQGKSTGYAGGLAPENIHENLKLISSVASDSFIWIDMESGLRTNNEFDLQKAIYILEATK